MWLTIIIVSVSVIGLGLLLLLSNRQYKHKVSKLTLDTDRFVCQKSLHKEINRIGELQKNLKELQNNIQQLQIPVLEKQEIEDTRDFPLSKLSKFYEKGWEWYNNSV